MRDSFSHIEKFRYRNKMYQQKTGDHFGCFIIPFEGRELRIIATDGEGIQPRWEHVSVSLPNRCPNWKEMSFVKNLFWNDTETVIEFHPKKDNYVNQHPYCLHLWKKYAVDYELPPMIFVGTSK